MSGRLLKCYGYCNQKHPKEELVKVGSQNHCKPCAEKKQKEKNDRDILYKTIQKIYDIPYPNGQMLRQISQFQTDRNYTLEGMTKTLCYFVKVKKQKPFLNGALSFLPYHYDSAIKYYDELDERRNNAKDIDNKVVHITIKPIKHSNEEVVRRRIIDLGGILHDG